MNSSCEPLSSYSTLMRLRSHLAVRTGIAARGVQGKHLVVW
jgi:hypothetical protein